MDHDHESSGGDSCHGDADRGAWGGAGPRYSRLGQLQVLGAAGFLGVLTAVAGLVLWTAINNRGQLPSLTLEEFEQAKLLWKDHAPPDYDVIVEVAGRQAAVYHVEVRAGEVVVSTRDAIPLRQRRTRGTWSVPGMFTTMQADVDNAERHREGTATDGVPQVLLRAMFDPQFGYPQRYHRTELRKFGNNDVVSWEVTQFDVISSEKVVSPAESSKPDKGTLE